MKSLFREKPAIRKPRARSGRRSILAVAAAFCTVIGAARTSAQAGGQSKPTKLGGAAAIAELSAPDPGRVGAAVDALGQRGDAASLDALKAFIARGQSDELANRAIEALGEARSPAAVPVLAELTRHLRPSARLAAYRSLARISGSAPDQLLGQGLRDGDANVRGLCARSLGERGARSQLELLFRAFERGVPEAGGAVGQLASASELPRFEGQLGRLPIQVMLAGYDALLQRQDMSEDAKLELVAHLGEVGSLSVKSFLEQTLASRNFAKQPRLLHALAETAKRIADRPHAQGAGKQ